METKKATWFSRNSMAGAIAAHHSKTKFGKKTKEFCRANPQFRLLMLCPKCDETITKEGSAKDDCPKYCECYENNYIRDANTGKYKKRDDCII